MGEILSPSLCVLGTQATCVLLPRHPVPSLPLPSEGWAGGPDVAIVSQILKLPGAPLYSSVTWGTNSIILFLHKWVDFFFNEFTLRQK